MAPFRAGSGPFQGWVLGTAVPRVPDAFCPLSQSGDLRHRQELSFTVEETTCRAPGTATTACKSRWLGVRLCPADVPNSEMGKLRHGEGGCWAPLGLISSVSPPLLLRRR